MPAPQLPHWAEVPAPLRGEYVPAGQAAQLAAPPTAKVPAAQVAQRSAVWAAENLPAGHAGQDDAPLFGWNCPAAQGAQLVEAETPCKTRMECAQCKTN